MPTEVTSSVQWNMNESFCVFSQVRHAEFMKVKMEDSIIIRFSKTLKHTATSRITNGKLKFKKFRKIHT